MRVVKKAIIPVAGLGTRFLPATKVLPKEMLPIVNKPVIQYIVEEAIEAGIEEIIIVTGKGKRAIEDHFDHVCELEQNLYERGKDVLLKQVVKSAKMADIHYIRQKEAKGLGHAIWCARKFIGNEPFAVLVGDDIVNSSTPCIKQLINQFNQYDSPIIGLKSDQMTEVNKTGFDQIFNENIRLIGDIKALNKEEIIGRYVLTPEIFSYLETLEPDSNGEIQLIDALKNFSLVQTIYGYQFVGERYKIGELIEFLTTNIEFALQNKALREPLLKYLENLVGKHVIHGM